jgi:hypothetical protein
MPDQDGSSSTSEFAAAFPARFANVLADARGTMAGISASADNGAGLIPPEALQRLHEIYRLRVELEIETAGVLWRTAEVVCALTDAIMVLNGRKKPAPLPPGGWLGGVARGVVERRRARLAMQDDEERRESRWPDLSPPLTSVDGDQGPAALAEGNGRRLAPVWRRPADTEIDAEAA